MYPSAILTGTANLTLFGLVVLLRRWIHKEGIASFGLHGDTKGQFLLLEGILTGLASFGLYSGSVILSRQGTLTLSWNSLMDTAKLIASWGVGFLGVALFEEALFRGYILQKLLKRFPVVVAIGLPALVFGALHFFSYSSSARLLIGILNASLIAAVMSISVIKSRSLMWALGFHWAWDLTQETLLAAQNLDVRTVVNIHITDGLWEGSSAVPESGFMVTLIFVGLGVYLLRRFKPPIEVMGQTAKERVL